MSWRFTEDVEEYARAAGALLAADPARHTISLTVIENARVRARETELYGWWLGPDGVVAGAVSHTPPFGLLLGVVPDEAVRPLVDDLGDIGRALPGVNGATALAAQFAAVWTRVTGERAVLEEAMRLYRLDRLHPPDPAPRGRARRATLDDTELVAEWLGVFSEETGALGPDPAAAAPDLLADGRLVLWEDDDGSTVSLAGRARTAAQVARVAPVYTPPHRRRHGWAAGVTAAVTQDALDGGAREVVLFTQLQNPTSNTLYQRLGYVPVTDRMVVDFEAR